MDIPAVSKLTQSRINEVLSRHADSESLVLPGGRLRLYIVKPLAQNGPQCGLVALAMAIQLLGLQEKDISEIFERAKELGLTAHGEVFSSHWLCQIASSLWPLYSEVTSFPEPNTLIKWLHSGYAVLIPYDCDKNHEPALRNGHGAHWSLMVGYLYVEDTSVVLREASADMTVDDDNAFYVFAYHGKSRHMGLWSYGDLRRSSLQLFEVGAKRSLSDYILPVDGLLQLRGKCVVLMKDKMNL